MGHYDFFVFSSSIQNCLTHFSFLSFHMKLRIRFITMLLGFLNKRFYLFLERREGREKERERNIDVWGKHWLVASLKSPTRGLACNSGMCPWQGIELRCFGLQDDSQPTEPHQPGRSCDFDCIEFQVNLEKIAAFMILNFLHKMVSFSFI